MSFSLVVQLCYWNGRVRQLAGFSFFGSTTLVLERPSPAAGWIMVLSGSTTLVLERPSPAAGWIVVLSGSTTLLLERAVSGGRLDFRSLVVQLYYWNGRLWRPGFSFFGSTTLLLERPSPAAGWILVPSGSTTLVRNGRLRWLAGFSSSGSTTLLLEQPSPAAGWIVVLW